MSHPRQRIREAAVLALKGKTSAGQRVYPHRLMAWREAELPALSVFTFEESVDPRSAQNSDRELERTLQLAVEGVIKPAENVDDALDALCLEIEHALCGDDTLGGTAGDVLLSATEMGVTIEANKPHGAARLTFTVRYFTTAQDLAEARDALRTADIRHSLDGAQAPADQAHDTINLPQE